jgi:carbamate kinase
MTDFGGPGETLLHDVSPDELDQIPLPAGSMGPKVTAATAFVRGGRGRRAAIGALAHAERVVAATAGTQIR